MLNQSGRNDIATKILKAITMKGTSNIEDVLKEPKEKAYFEKLVFLDNLMRRHFPALTSHQIWKLYTAKYPEIIGKTTYYNDRKNAERVFGSIASHNKDYKRSIYVEWLEHVHSLAIANGDYKAAERALKTAAEILQLHLPDPEIDEQKPTKFEIHLNFSLPDGSAGTKIINIDDIQNFSPMDLKAIADIADRPKISVEDMTKMLNEDGE